MTLKDLLHKHKNLQQQSAATATATSPQKHNGPPARRSTDRSTASYTSEDSPTGPIANNTLVSKHNNENLIPEFTFLRTTTNTQEIISPPHFDGDESVTVAKRGEEKHDDREKGKRRTSLLRGAMPSRTVSSQSVRSSKEEEIERYGRPSNSNGSNSNGGATLAQPARPEMKRKLSDRLGLTSRGKSQSRGETSPHIPETIGKTPEFTPAPLEPPDARGRSKPTETKEEKALREARWEKRACALAMHLHVPSAGPWGMASSNGTASSPRRNASGSFVDEKMEVNIQEAIRLHEAGNLERSTAIFGRLADPKGVNNPLSQVLYGLALRHGWGVEASAEHAILYLSLAARTSAQIQQMSEGGGDAKGELILAMFELGNCFRFGWGCKIDKAAARAFYEVAANLGDPDALEEMAWCCMEGFGGPKDKFRGAQYYRLSECAGRRRVGESWIWKDKYQPPGAK